VVGDIQARRCPSRRAISVKNGRLFSLTIRYSGAGQRGQRLLVGQVALVGSELDLDERARCGAEALAQCGRQPVPAVVAGHVAPEALTAVAGPPTVVASSTRGPHGAPNRVEVIDKCVQPRLVQDQTAHRFGMPDQQAQREGPPAARAEDHRRTHPDRA
jgi:hypothetical protein